MPGLSTVHTNPDGVRMVLPQRVLDVAKRINEGDMTVGWSGDPRMFVVFNPTTIRYEVWRDCEDGRERIEASFPADEFDTRVLRWLSEHDARNVDVLKKVDENNRRIEKERERTLDELVEESKRILYRGAQGSYLPGVDVKSPGVH